MTVPIWLPVKHLSRLIKLKLSILLLNFGRQADDFGSNLVATSKILVAMATEMVLTWRVVERGTTWIPTFSFSEILACQATLNSSLNKVLLLLLLLLKFSYM